MKTFVVIPCFNEQENLAATCFSLGFGLGRAPSANLVLVDNASTDSTPEVMAQLREAVGVRNISIVYEPTRGYVPARHAGVSAVIELARQEGFRSDDVLVLQADADTKYLPGYIDAMSGAISGRPGELIEGAAVVGREFRAEFPEFHALCCRVDYSVEPWFAADEAQVIVDDKVCGFSLADYYRWGGHRREIDSLGREIYAETTRLFMHAKRAQPAYRIKVAGACAVPSRRRLWTQGPAYFASAGFPRDAEWIRSWVRQLPSSRDFLTTPFAWPSLTSAIRSRQRHLLALFCLLPAACQNGPPPSQFQLALVSALRHLAGNDEPKCLLEAALFLADEENGILDKFLDQGLLPRSSLDFNS